MATFPGSLPIPPLRPENLPVSKFFVHIGHGEFVRADLIQGVDMIESNEREIHLEGTYSRSTCNIYVQNPPEQSTTTASFL